MFDLITGKTEHLQGGGGKPVAISIAAHVAGLGAVIVLPLLFVTSMPEAPGMMAAFVVAAPVPPPPPPPPPPPAARVKATPAHAPSANPNAAPIDVPARIEPEAVVATGGDEEEGVVGGVDGGVFGGVVGGMLEAPPPPPPAPEPPPAPRTPVRVGGQIAMPTLVTRVEPLYPPLAVKAHVEGTVILEATVDETGIVRNVRVLRSIPLLDKAAIAAVEEWRYTPVTLNGRPVPFILTVVLSFSMPIGRS